MTSITWADPRCVQGLAAILGPQNRTQGRCGVDLFLHCVEQVLFEHLAQQTETFLSQPQPFCDSLLILCFLEFFGEMMSYVSSKLSIIASYSH